MSHSLSSWTSSKPTMKALFDRTSSMRSIRMRLMMHASLLAKTSWLLRSAGLTVAYLTVLLLMPACRDADQQSGERHRAFVLSDTMMRQIGVDTVRLTPMHGILSLTGRVIADENHLIDVFPFVGGTVQKVTVELGDYVSKGQVLAIIRSGEVAEYERQLADARSDLALAQKNLAVQRDLLGSKLASERDVLSAQRELAKAEAELNRIEEIYRIYGITNKSEYVVRAPIDGFVIRKDVNTDMTLRADRSSSMFTVARLNEVWVMADVYENDISKVSPGVAAEITTVAYPDSLILASVDKVFNVIDDRTRTMAVRMRVPNADAKLKPGMAAVAKVRYSRPGEMLSVAASSVVFDAGKAYVVVYRDRRNLRVQEVGIQETVEGRTYVTSGLNTGDVVLSKGQLFVYDALTD
ncbi:MAG: efflux RND transporter periplasmic adaptor subunit [Candidatus Kapabacteria bacterium]|nr:efflux RND transporter periplasmic adaptor subunit [Candidatus Kapabacteria bacterium]